jgi:hypothetical protein
VDQKYVGSFKCGAGEIMEISWTDRVGNEEYYRELRGSETAYKQEK